jgi:hypothetical protein
MAEEAWAPWLYDPDPPEKPLTPEQLKRLSDGVGEWLRKRRAAEKRAATAGKPNGAETV